MTELADPRIVEYDVRTDEMFVNMGPQHPSTHGVLKVVLRTDGEVVYEAVPEIGFLHRCAEKIGENLTPVQWVPYTDRMDYLAGMNMNLGWSLAVEKLLGLEVPPRGQALRVIVAELNRIASHLLGMGAYGMDLGTFAPFLYGLREREVILDLFEELCGARLTYSYVTIGGTTHPMPERMRVPPGLAALTETDPQREMTFFRRRAAVSGLVDGTDPRVSRVADDQRDLRETCGGPGGVVARNGDRILVHRSGVARERCRFRPAPRRGTDLYENV